MSLTSLLQTFSEEREVVKEEGKYIEKDKGGVSLKGVLQRGRLKMIKERSTYAQGLTFRPSSITYSYCRRAKIAQLAGKLDLFDDKPTPKLQLVFDMGHAIHDIIQGYCWDIGILKGTYKCLKCDSLYHSLVAPTACPSGIAAHTKKHLKYKEVTCSATSLPIAGRCDGILVIDGEEHIMDIKSISNRGIGTSDRQFCFEDLDQKGPKSDHVVQLNLYMWMMDIHRGHLLYVAKNGHMMKSFAIPYDYEVIRPYIEEIMSLIEQAELLKKDLPIVLPEPCANDKCKCDEILSKQPR